MGLVKQTLQKVKDGLAPVGAQAKEVGNTAGNAVLGGLFGAVNQALFKEYFASGSMSGDIIMKRAEQILTSGSANRNTDANVITNGSLIDIQANQCMIIVENGRVVEACMEPGQYVYDTSIAPSFFEGDGNVFEKAKRIAIEAWEQAKMGGQRHTTQRIYFINMGILDASMNWGFGNVSFRHTERFETHAAPLTVGITLKSYGTIRVRMARPVDFYETYGAKYAGGDNPAVVTLKTLSTVLEAAHTRIQRVITGAITDLGKSREVKYDEINTSENIDFVEAKINEGMLDTDICRMGFMFYEFNPGDGGFVPTDADKERIQKRQDQVFMSNGQLNIANIDVQQTLAGGYATGFAEAGKHGGAQNLMGFGMAAGMSGMGGLGNMQPMQQAMPQQPMQQPVQQPMQQPVQGAAVVAPQNANTWTCPNCGTTASGKFCMECGTQKPAPVNNNAWTCSCGATSTSKFCPECGKQRPARRIKCDKCGWMPEEGAKAPKFCPDCGDPINEFDFE